MIKKRFWLKAYLLTLALFAFFATLVAVVVLLEVKSQLAAQLLDAAQLEAVWNSVWVKTLVIGLLAFCCFALLLYIVLLSLSKPLEDLAFTEQRFAAGNYGIRAKYTGKDEIGRLARSFNHMAESVESSIHSLEENAELKQQLVDNLSHELRTPLTAINGYADYVWQAALDENEIYEQMEKIKNETQRLLRISNRMLEISALRDANRKQNKTPINPVRVRRLFTQVNSSLSPAAKIQGVTLQVDSPATDYIIQGDPALLESLCVNLVHNAMKACEAGQGVHLYCEALPKAGLKICVEDSGCGMSAEQLSHLGEEFYRADKARSRRHGGAGLGVALCFQIAQAHGAALSYKSQLNVGTLATVTFPPELIRLGED